MHIHTIRDLLEEVDRKHARKIGRQLAARDERFFEASERFFAPYVRYLEAKGQTLGFAVECYVRMRADMEEERTRFLATGGYSNHSYKEVEKAVYANRDVMTYHMHGLLLAQFLWPDQYERFRFFAESLLEFCPGAARVLELGGGHGLYTGEAVRQLDPASSFDFVDISPTSIELAQEVLKGLPVNFEQKDLFALDPGSPYDFVILGEVLEHVEDPIAMLRKIASLLAPGGRMYVTTPANAPMIDHIYLFRDAGEIESLLGEAAWKILRSTSMYADDMPAEAGERFLFPLMYAAFVEKAA